ncbi:TetR/AcrR family transcriptional regulator [Trujillonella endophytica]|uniref:Transcriptional regulator, TetR family n=1 Tax=Trujillonella endophytica TaxID=673521 RepID=A0A1H8T6W2_9ACTN|nr:TetR-like C-terminal domain-containing protein [Trujillella endophytica]SEO86334.1 transcriptional regulator, TetR family [Trujillella endophytica]
MRDDEPAPSPRRGRPRDAAVDDRIHRAARAVYAARGWAGFNFDVVAREAGVSKDAIYRRYTSRVDLLLSAMERTFAEQTAVAPGADLREYLVAVATVYFHDFAEGTGRGSLRLFIEAPDNPELTGASHRLRSVAGLHRMRSVIRDAMAAGRLPATTSPTQVIEAILGAIVMHVLVTPSVLRERMLAESSDYVDGVVDLVLRGCGYRFPGE